MEALPLILGAIALVAAAACVWLLRERAGLAGARDDARREREEAVRRAESLQADLSEQDARARALLERLQSLTAECATFKERVAAHDRAAERLTQERVENEQHLKNAFEALASKTFRANSEQFLELARTAFRAEQEKAKGDIEARRKAVDDLLKPINEALTRTDQKLEKLDQSRVESQASLSKHITMVMEQTKLLETQTHRLVQSLKSPHVRGRWGEMQLRRVVELAGMSEHCDFSEQATSAGADADGARLRPDMMIHLPGERLIVVDAKTPLSAYLEAIEADTDEHRAERLKAHARQVRQRVEELRSKAYQSALDCTPDFTVLFVPGDHFLAAALREEPDLLDRAAAERVIITTPVTLIALLKAVSFGWTQASLAEDARAVLTLGRELHERVAKMTDHLARMGKSLSGAVGAYNDLLGNVERRVKPAAAKLTDHNVRSRKALEDGRTVDETPRLPAQDDASDSDAPDPPIVEVKGGATLPFAEGSGG